MELHTGGWVGDEFSLAGNLQTEPGQPSVSDALLLIACNGQEVRQDVL